MMTSAGGRISAEVATEATCAAQRVGVDCASGSDRMRHSWCGVLVVVVLGLAATLVSIHSFVEEYRILHLVDSGRVSFVLHPYK